MSTIGTGGADIKAINTGTVTVDLASIAAATAVAVDVTISGVAVGDALLLFPSAADPSVAVAVGAAYVTGTDTATIFVVNPSAGALDAASQTYRYVWFDLT